MTQEEMQGVFASHLAAENRQDVDGALATYHEHCFLEPVPFGARLEGKRAVGLVYHATYRAFPDAVFRVEGEAFGRDVMVVWGTVTATLRAEWLGLPPTGRRATYPMAAVVHFRDALMEGERQYWDLASCCQQLGLSLEEVRGALASLRTPGS